MSLLSSVLGQLKLLSGNTNKLDMGVSTGGIPYIALQSANGTTNYIYATNAGNIAIGTAEPTTDSSATGGMLTADITITSAQVLALNATPITLIAAPGANKTIIVEKVLATTAGGTAYAGIAVGEDLAIRYTDGSGTIQTAIETTGWLDQTSAQVRVASLPQSAAGTAKVELTPTANAAVVAHLLTGEITTGNYDIKLRIFYRIVPTVL